MKYFVILIASLTLPSCLCGGGGSILPSLQTRAAFELECPIEKLSIEHLGQWGVKGVSGCGKKAVYVYINGQWLRNSGGQDMVIQAALIEKQRREEEERREGEERRRDEEEWRRQREKFSRELRKAAEDRP